MPSFRIICDEDDDTFSLCRSETVNDQEEVDTDSPLFICEGFGDLLKFLAEINLAAIKPVLYLNDLVDPEEDHNGHPQHG